MACAGGGSEGTCLSPLVPEEDIQEAQCFYSAACPVKYKAKLHSLELKPWFPFLSLLGSSALTALLRGLLGRGGDAQPLLGGSLC